MKYPIYQIDAFTDTAFKGNPAAVVPMPEFAPDHILQAIAMENNLSETAFIVADGADYLLRWFTPENEIDLCGHATMGAAQAIFTFLQPECDQIHFKTVQSGTLTVTRKADGLLEMDFPIWSSRETQQPDAIVQAMGPQRPVSVRDAGRDLILIYSSPDDIMALSPDMKKLENAGYVCVIATAPGKEADFVSRVFCPRCGVPEDPVTGSAHCSLVPYWAERLGKTELKARQISARGGLLYCSVQGDRLAISGYATVYMKGEIFINTSSF